MNNNCEYSKSNGYCLCSACQSVTKALQEVEKISQEEINQMFSKLNDLTSETTEELFKEN